MFFPIISFAESTPIEGTTAICGGYTYTLPKGFEAKSLKQNTKHKTDPIAISSNKSFGIPYPQSSVSCITVDNTKRNDSYILEDRDIVSLHNDGKDSEDMNKKPYTNGIPKNMHVYMLNSNRYPRHSYNFSSFLVEIDSKGKKNNVIFAVIPKPIQERFKYPEGTEGEHRLLNEEEKQYFDKLNEEEKQFAMQFINSIRPVSGGKNPTKHSLEKQ